MAIALPHTGPERELIGGLTGQPTPVATSVATIHPDERALAKWKRYLQQLQDFCDTLPIRFVLVMTSL
jgi:hypothetical protein